MVHVISLLATSLFISVYLSFRQCCVGTELVDWMMQQSPCVHSRSQAVGMWQVLLEEGVLNHGKFKNKNKSEP